MNIFDFEQRLYNLLLNHLNKKYVLEDYFELLKMENNSFLNYLLSHAYFAVNDKENAEKYRHIAIKLNSNFDFEEDYSNVSAYIYYLFSTITTQTNPFCDDDLEKKINSGSNANEYFMTAEEYRIRNDMSNSIRIANLGLERYKEEKSLKYAIASALLYTRNLDNAWVYNELRFDEVRHKLPQYINKPKFNLQKTSAKVYIYPVTKLGDTIFFTRYIFKLKKDYPNLKLFVSPDTPLRQLFEDNGIRTYNTPEKSMVDYQISFEGLPYLYKDAGTKIYTDGYLKANKEKSEAYKKQIFNTDKLKIGLIWKTSKPQDKRNIPIEQLKELFNIDNVQFYSLQKETNLVEDVTIGAYSIPNLGAKFNDFSDTAAAIDNLDYIIGCDTAVTNLSCAMGKKTFIILPYNADWRWGLFEQNSEWYKSAQLYRQKKNQNDFHEVIFRIKNNIQPA